MNDKLYRSGYRLSNTSNCYVHRIGAVVFYDSAGHKVKEGAYLKNGIQTGHWKYYSKETGKLFKDEEYEKGVANKSWTYNGTDTLFVETDRSDELVTYSHYLNHHLVKRIIKEYGVVVSANCFDEHRVKIPCPIDSSRLFTDTSKQITEVMPSARFDVAKYLNENLHYPEQARVHNTEGRVIVKFVITEEGEITDVSLHKGIGDFCDQEAMRVVGEMPLWKPGMQNGVPVRVYFTLPIVFKLEGY